MSGKRESKYGYALSKEERNEKKSVILRQVYINQDIKKNLI